MQTRSEQRPSWAGDAVLWATIALSLAAGWLFVGWLFVQDFADFLFGGAAIDPATRDALVNSEPAPLWQQLLMPFAMIGLIAAPVVVLWLVARGGQALHDDLLALRTGAGRAE